MNSELGLNNEEVIELELLNKNVINNSTHTTSTLLL